MSELNNRSPAHSVSVGVGQMTTGGKRDLGVKIKKTTKKWKLDRLDSRRPKEQDSVGEIDPITTDEIRQRIPSTLTGRIQTGKEKGNSNYRREDVPVSIEERTIEQNSKYEHHYRPVPGGCQIYDREGLTGEDDSSGTSTTPIYSTKKDKHVLLTAGHIYNDNDTAIQPEHQYIGSNDIGEVSQRSVYDVFDAATIDPDGTDLVYRLASNNGDDEYSYPIRGYATIEEIKDHLDEPNYGLYLQGKTTGFNRGDLLEVDYEMFDGYNISARIEIGVDSDAGDSGGPHLKMEDTANGRGAYIAGVHGWGRGSYSAISTSMSSIIRHLDVTWS